MKEKEKQRRRMKKWILILFSCCLCLLPTIKGKAASSLQVFCNGKKIDLSKTTTKLENGIALLPYQEVFEKSNLGIQVKYHSKKKTISFFFQSDEIIVTVGKKQALVNGKKTNMPLAAKSVTIPKTKKKTILVPSRFIAQTLGFDYTYSSKKGSISIQNKKGMKLKCNGKTFYDNNKQIEIFINNQKITSNMPALVWEGQLLLPANRVFSSVLKADYQYDKGKKIVTLKQNGKIVRCKYQLIKKAETGQSYIMIPGKNAAEGLGYIFSWDAKKRVVQIKEKEEQPEKTEEETGTDEEETEIAYSLKFPLPDGVSFTDLKQQEQYHKRMFVITIPGKQKAFYEQEEPQQQDSNIEKVQIKETTGGNTEISITTKKIQAMEWEERAGQVYLNFKNPKEVYEHVVVLDAGHGGSDSGAVGNGVVEKDTTLKIVQQVDKLLKKEPQLEKEKQLKVYFTRMTDVQEKITAGSTGVSTSTNSLKARYTFANELGADLFLSVHINAAGSTSAKGTETYYCSSNTNKNKDGLTSKQLAQVAYEKLCAAVGSGKRGVKAANFSVIKNTKMPAALLEVGFLSNKQDASILKDQSKIEKIGKAIYDTMIEVTVNR